MGTAVTSPTQGLVAAALAAVLLRITLTGEYLNFVQPWMRWPLLVTGLALLLMAVRPALGWGPVGNAVPQTSWLLLLPTLIVFTVAPPPLGAYIAERRVTQAPATLPAPVTVPVSTDGGPLELGVEEFTWGAADPDDVMDLAGQVVRMEGFVSTDKEGSWYLTRLVIYCCAADVSVERVKIIGQPAPPRDQWIRVTGTWVQGTGAVRSDPAQLTASRLVRIPTPKNPYS